RTKRRVLRVLVDGCRKLLAVLPIRVVELEEIAFLAVRGVLLIDECEVAGVERFEPLVPRNVLQFLTAVPREVEAQDAEVTVVLGTGDGGRCRATLLSPPL